MIRTGETVAVPTGCNRTRCGISEPVTKTVTSFGCLWRTVISLTGTGLPASRVPPNIVTATRIIALGDNIVFMSDITPREAAVQITETAKIGPYPQQQERQWIFATASLEKILKQGI
jgi:hypothetical protein